MRVSGTTICHACVHKPVFNLSCLRRARSAHFANGHLFMQVGRVLPTPFHTEISGHANFLTGFIYSQYITGHILPQHFDVTMNVPRVRGDMCAPMPGTTT